MNYSRDDFKRDCDISDAFIDKIDKLTNLNIPNISTKHIKPSEFSLGNNNLSANKDCRFFGRYYEIEKGIELWIGYDLRKTKTKRFYVSFWHKEDIVKKEIKNCLENLTCNYEAEYCSYKNEGYWYNVYLDKNLIYLDCSDVKKEIEKVLNIINTNLKETN